MMSSDKGLIKISNMLMDIPKESKLKTWRNKSESKYKGNDYTPVTFNSMFLQPIDQQYDNEKEDNKYKKMNLSTDSSEELTKADDDTWDFLPQSNCTTASSNFFSEKNKKNTHSLFFSNSPKKNNNNNKLKLSNSLLPAYRESISITKYKILKKMILLSSFVNSSNNMMNSSRLDIRFDFVSGMERNLINKIKSKITFPILECIYIN
jgi:hypothetical protein